MELPDTDTTTVTETPTPEPAVEVTAPAAEVAVETGAAPADAEPVLDESPPADVTAEDAGVAPDPEASALAALQAQLDEQAAALAAQGDQLGKARRSMLEGHLDRLGVKGKFRGYAPDVDPFTDAGKAKLEAWAKDNPELLERVDQPLPEAQWSEPEAKGMKRFFGSAKQQYERAMRRTGGGEIH